MGSCSFKMSLDFDPDEVVPDDPTLEAGGGLKRPGDGIGGRGSEVEVGGKVGEAGMDPPKCLVSFMWVVNDWRLG